MEAILSTITECYAGKCTNSGIEFLRKRSYDIQRSVASSQVEENFNDAIVNLINAAINLQETRL